MKTFIGLVLLALTLEIQAAGMIELRYEDTEADGSVYVTRYLVTTTHLRMDSGNNEDDFVLLDRKTGEAVNVIHAQRLLMRIKREPVPKSVLISPRESGQSIGTAMQRTRVHADETLCVDTVVDRSLHPDAARAMAEFKSTLAYTHWQTWRNTPTELQQRCDLVHYANPAPGALKHGVPLEERDYSGRFRRLAEASTRPVIADLFKLPDDYTTMRLPKN